MPNPSVEIKAELRRTVIDRVKAMPAMQRMTEQRSLFSRFQALPGLAEARAVLLYLSAFEEEIHTWSYCEWALKQGKRLFLPRVSRKPWKLRLMEVVDLERDLASGALGISEPRLDRPEADPKDIDWALIPGVAFDTDGYRLGRGGGYYDRLLPQLRAEAPCWAIAFDCQLVPAEQLPREPHDMPLCGVLTASEILTGERGVHRPSRNS